MIDELMSAILKKIRIFESGFYTMNSRVTPDPSHRSTAAFHVTSRGAAYNTTPNTDGKRKVYKFTVRATTYCIHAK